MLVLVSISACGGGGDQGRGPILGLPAASLLTLNISPVSNSIQIGGVQQFVATASYADGSSRIVSADSSWTSSSTVTASVSNAGLSQGILAGATTITASYAGHTATANLTVLPATLISITVTPPNPTIPVGNQQTFKAMGNFSDGSSTDISAIAVFSTSNPLVAGISSTGIATGLSGGITSVIASSGGIAGTTNLTVGQAALVQLTMTPQNPSLRVGASRSLIVTAIYTDGSTINVSASSTYTSATSAIAKVVFNTGLVTGVTPGSSVVSATFNGMTASTTVTVLPVAIVSIALTPLNPTIFIAATQNFAAAATYEDASVADISSSVVWGSSDITKATILSGGSATGLAAGSSIITATFQTKSASTLLTVVAMPTIATITVTPTTSSIMVGGAKNLIATAVYSDNSTMNVTNTANWNSSQPLTATVSPNGLVTGVSVGASLINASLNGLTGSAAITVTPLLVMTSITVSPINPSATVGSTLQFVATAVYDNLSTENISSSVVWSSSKPLIGTISNSAPKGQASALSVGSTLVTASQGGISGNTILLVNAAPIAGINLRTAENFAVLAGNSITNNSGGLTLITGDVGSPSQTVDPVQTAGYTNYKSGLILDGALADVQVAIADANSRTCDVNAASGINLGGLTLPPGVYCYAGAITITGTFTMNGPGLYIFRSSSTLDSSANSIVALNGGASAANVFWVPTAPTTLGANSAFVGTIMTTSAAITMGDMATLQNGRVLSASAVTLKNNVITR